MIILSMVHRHNYIDVSCMVIEEAIGRLSAIGIITDSLVTIVLYSLSLKNLMPIIEIKNNIEREVYS
jgi:hypothetical protein